MNQEMGVYILTTVKISNIIKVRPALVRSQTWDFPNMQEAAEYLLVNNGPLTFCSNTMKKCDNHSYSSFPTFY